MGIAASFSASIYCTSVMNVGWCTYIEAFKRRVGLWAIDKQFWFISNVMLLETVMPL